MHSTHCYRLLPNCRDCLSDRTGVESTAAPVAMACGRWYCRRLWLQPMQGSLDPNQAKAAGPGRFVSVTTVNGQQPTLDLDLLSRHYDRFHIRVGRLQAHGRAL